MRPLESWFPTWLKVHLKLHKHTGLPDPASEEGKVVYRVWARHFRDLEVTEAEAAEASERLYGLAVHEARHFATLLEMIRASRSGRDLAVAEDPEVTARRQSRTCTECEGNGLALRYRQKTIAAPLLLYCLCPLGRHLQRTGRGPGDCRDLAEFAWLQGESGERFRRPPAPLRIHRPTEPAGTSEFSRWWATGQAEPNVPESAVS